MKTATRLELLSKRLWRLMYVVGEKTSEEPPPIMLQEFIHITIATASNCTVLPHSYLDKHAVSFVLGSAQ